MAPSRRAVLVAGLATLGVAGTGAALVETDVLPGRVAAHRVLGLDGPPGDVPDVEPGPVLTGAFDSHLARRRTGWTVAYPPGSSAGDRLPVCVVLHGRGGTHRELQSLGLDRFLADHVRRGGPRFALASVDGGDRYWHARRPGDDTGARVSDELLPRLAARGLATGPTDRFAALGWSMGGYGALHLAQRLTSRRVAAVAAESPALWLHPGDSAPGAFDDADDFRRNDVFPRRSRRLAGVHLQVNCGQGDPFLHATRVFVSGLTPRPAGGFQPGGHDGGYWRRMAPAQMAFVGRALSG